MHNPFDLQDKTILVTGASEGIGRAIAIEISKHGAQVLLSSRNKIKLEETKKILSPGNHRVLPADLTLEKDLQNLVDDLPVLDGVVFNAGLTKTLPAKYIKDEDYNEVFNVNIKSPVLLNKLLLKQKKINRGGSLCFISSIASRYVHKGNSLYSASKGALNSYTRSLALEMAPRQIRVNGILPGMIETGLLNNSTISQEQLEQHKKNYPLGRYGKPEEVAYMVVYLLSDASAWVTGSLFTIDGGYSLK
jgi:NAD(P)-dependent dehydrogenase (short-subunit alcohol dehydrogenase family)